MLNKTVLFYGDFPYFHPFLNGFYPLNFGIKYFVNPIQIGNEIWIFGLFKPCNSPWEGIGEAWEIGEACEELVKVFCMA